MYILLIIFAYYVARKMSRILYCIPDSFREIPTAIKNRLGMTSPTLSARFVQGDHHVAIIIAPRDDSKDSVLSLRGSVATVVRVE